MRNLKDYQLVIYKNIKNLVCNIVTAKTDCFVSIYTGR